MRKSILFLILLNSVTTLSNTKNCDTISHWKIYINNQLIREGIINGDVQRIEFPKKSIKGLDIILNIKYFEDTRCSKCDSKFIIKTCKGKLIKTISSSDDKYSFKIKTTELQMMVFINKVNLLRFYFKKEKENEPMLLFEIEVK